MLYVRTKQAIYHCLGKRDPETKKMEQQILITIYSKAEAQQILGQSSGRVT